MEPEILIGLIFAPFIGSFLGVMIDRLPTGRPILTGRSVCDSCESTLEWTDLIPLLSFLYLRGHCRICKRPLAAFYLIIELAAVAVVVVAAIVLSGALFWLSLGLGWCLLVLAFIDQRHLILPDQLTLPLIPAGIAVAYIIDPGLTDDHLIGCAAGYAAFAGVAWLYRVLRGREGLGLGDAKLLAGTGAWLGWAALPGVVLMAAFTALSLCLLRLLAGDKMHVANQLPFGPHLALAFWTSWLLGPLTLV